VTIPNDQDELRDVVRARYAAAATATDSPAGAGCCSADSADSADSATVTEQHFGQALYDVAHRDQVPAAAALASLGCGNPTAIAELHPGETVLDLGSGGGLDVRLSAHRVGPTGLAYGLDMTDEMLDLARRNQAEAGVTNVQWLRGDIEQIPLPRDTVDVIISNCVMNLSADKAQVLREAARVLKPGGRFAVCDVIADPDIDDITRANMQASTGCVAGALTRNEFTDALQDVGLTDVSIQETHKVHKHAAAAIVRATKPGVPAATTSSQAAAQASPDACCSSAAHSTCCDSAAKRDCCNPDQHAGGGCGCQSARVIADKKRGAECSCHTRKDTRLSLPTF
jgi:arsenite methyltransferase